MEQNASGGTSDENGKVSDLENDNKELNEDKVSYESHKKLLGQYKNAKSRMTEIESQNLEMQQRLQAIESEKLSAEESKLLKSGEKDKIIQMREQKIKELEDKYGDVLSKHDTLQQSMVASDKLYAFYDKLPGKIKRNEYLKHVPLDKIVIDPESGEIDSQSVDIVVNEFMENYSDLVDTKQGRYLPGDAAKSGGTVNSDNFKNLSLKDMRANMPQAVAAMKAKLGVN